MTDKELKKLSRLELLELLLAESRENERLRAELEQIKQENSMHNSVQRLNEISEKLDETLQKLYLVAGNTDKVNEASAETADEGTKKD
ncbi:MAG: hypothetical protein UD936_09165 [Acutalibacteraceae bacterium]|nr:hypothetical protein [Acutalibacteraceae bacterium]